MNEAFKPFWLDLNDYYNKSITNPRVVYEYEKHTQGVPKERAGELFSLLVNNYDFFPKLSEFSVECKKFKARSERKETTNKVRCPYCMNTGLIKYKASANGVKYKGEFFATCVCPKGRSFASKYYKAFCELYGEQGLETLKSRNTQTHNVSELQKEVIENMSKIGQGTNI